MRMKGEFRKAWLVAGVFATFACFLSAAEASYTETTLYPFCSASACKDGSNPLGELVTGGGGILYGTTNGGGNGYEKGRNPGDGVVFGLTTDTGGYSVVYRFCSKTACADGLHPGDVKLVIDTAGNLYGTTFSGGTNGSGVVFELIPSGSAWREKTLYSFCAKKHCKDGAGPATGLTYSGATAGQPYDGISPLFGTTEDGGAYLQGSVFSISPKTGTKKWTETVLYSFCPQSGCSDGMEPTAPLLVDGSGNIYGTTEFGGQANLGTAYEISKNGTEYISNILYSFCAQTNCTDGEGPHGGLVMDSGGNLFGSTASGGSGQGLLFELSANGDGWQYNVLEEFNGANGSGPEGALIIDSSNNLFGTTFFGGAQKKGTVFEFNGAIQTLYSFCTGRNCPDGKEPVAGVIEDGSGNLYGVTSAGANKNSGTIIELSPSETGASR